MTSTPARLTLVAASLAIIPALTLAQPAPPTPSEKPAKQPMPAGEPEQRHAEAQPPAPDEQPKPIIASPFVLAHAATTIDGKPVNLADYTGKVVLIVNTASKCGFTPQYQSLEALYQQHKDQGLVVLGFPANDFGKQEPGTNEEIAQFCTSEYAVTFPMMAKIAVKGDGQHALYHQLALQPAPIGGEVKWNFTKFLVDRSGKVVARFEPRVKPNDPTLLRQVKDLLASAPAAPRPVAPASPEAAPASPK